MISIKRLFHVLKVARSFRLEILRKPYDLDEITKQKMKEIFSTIMAELSFGADDSFLQRLYSTDILLILRSRNREIVGFTNIVHREIDGRQVYHILATYVHPKWRSLGLMEFSVLRWLAIDFMRSPFKRREIILTASAVNPVVVKAMSKRFEVWPDLLNNTPSPAWAETIAKESAARFYPIQTGRLFQVEVPKEFVRLQEKDHIKTRDDAFNTRFFSYAKPEECKLLFFVGRVTLRRLLLSFTG